MIFFIINICLIILAKTFYCSKCSNRFGSERLLNDHSDTHRLEIRCQHCPLDKNGQGKYFPKQSNLNTHITYIHSDLRQFPCNETGILQDWLKRC